MEGAVIHWLYIAAGVVTAWLLVHWMERRRGLGMSGEALAERLEEEDRRA
jgi:hypothetical protein